MTKRELPPRCNRGKNSFYNTEIETLKDQKTRISTIKSKKISQSPISEESQKKLKILAQNKRQLFNENKKAYKFTRGIHYFYDLNKLQRVQNSISYAIFPSKKQRKISKTNSCTITYSNDERLIGNTPISALINRNCIGLPKHQQNQQQQQYSFLYHQKTINEVIQLKRNDKNQCHNYLFQCEDKKNNLDRMIKQLQFIRKKINFYLQPQNIIKLKSFSIIQKDNDLFAVFLDQAEDFTDEERIQTLDQKILNLREKRQKLNKVYQSVSNTYYQNSLDQKLFNKIKQQKNKLNRFQIYQEMEKNIKKHQPGFAMTPQNAKIYQNFQNFHKQSKDYSRNSQLDEYYCIDQKKFDPFIMEKALKIISIRLFHEGENCFYFAKKVYLRLFDKQITLEKQIRPTTIQQYTSKMTQIEDDLEKYWKKKINKQQSQKSKLINKAKSIDRRKSKSIDRKTIIAEIKDSQSKQVSKKKITLKINQKVIPIQFYEYYCLIIFKAIHDSLLVIKEFMQKSQNKKHNLIQQLASLNYPKLQNKLLTIVQIPKFGLLSQALDKLVDIITHKSKQFEPMNYELFVQYNDKSKEVVTFVKQMESHMASEESSLFKRSNSMSQYSHQDNIGDEQGFDNLRKEIKAR